MVLGRILTKMGILQYFRSWVLANCYSIWNLGSCLANSTVVIHSDNSAVVHVINKTTSKDTKPTQRLMILSLSHNIHFQAYSWICKYSCWFTLSVTDFRISHQISKQDKVPTLVPASHVKIWILRHLMCLFAIPFSYLQLQLTRQHI